MTVSIRPNFTRVGHGLVACLAVLVFLSIAPLRAQQPDDKAVVGSWMGTLTLQGMKLRIVFNISLTDGKYTTTLDSPDQGVNGIPVPKTTFEGSSLKMAIPAIAGVYQGTWKNDNLIDGTWSQSGAVFPLVLNRLDKPIEIKRPQNPAKPYPYTEKEISFENSDAGCLLTGTLTLPPGNGPFPAVVLLTGSGAQDRDEMVFNHRPFLVLADHLTRKGIAVLRYDDRGVGKSTGQFATATTADFAMDAVAAVRFLKSVPEIDTARIGLLGHSEGGVVAPIAASMLPSTAFIVLLAGTGLPGEDILYMQSRLIAKAEGKSDKEIEKSRKLQEKLFAVAKNERDDSTASYAIDAVMSDYLASLPEEERKDSGMNEAMMKQQKASILSPWFRYFLTLDPRDYLVKVRCPVLALNGELDLQVPAKENTSAIEKTLKNAGNKDVTIKIFPGLNHLFQHCKTGSPTEYSAIEETFAPRALDMVSVWILERVRK
jgi:uncharacterized protein